MRLICPVRYISILGLHADGTPYEKIEDSHISLNVQLNGIRCRSFDWKSAQLLARLFPRIRRFTVSHTSISVAYIDQISYLLTQWSPTLMAFKFHSDYTLVNPDDLCPVALDVINSNSTFLDAYLTLFFSQLETLPKLKQLTLHYTKGKINSTVTNFAFLPRLEELHLDRTSLEANLQAACQRYLAPPVSGDPQPVLRRFSHNVKQIDSTEIEFARFLQYSPEALPLTTATIWYQRNSFLSMDNLRVFLLRFRSLGYLHIHNLPGITLAPLSRSLSGHTISVITLGIGGTTDVGEEEADIVPVPSVRGLTIRLYSPDHDRVYPLLAQILPFLA